MSQNGDKPGSSIKEDDFKERWGKLEGVMKEISNKLILAEQMVSETIQQKEYLNSAVFKAEKLRMIQSNVVRIVHSTPPQAIINLSKDDDIEVLHATKVNRGISLKRPLTNYDPPSLEIGMTVFAKNEADDFCSLASVIQEIESADNKAKVSYMLAYKNGTTGYMTGDAVAFPKPPENVLREGTRVCAKLYKNDEYQGFCLGLIGERVQPNNRFRHLVFYDDGSAAYVNNDDVRMVIHGNQHPRRNWQRIPNDDQHESVRRAMKRYLYIYPRVDWINVKPGKTIQVKKGYDWYMCDVIEVDYSMVLIRYPHPSNEEEWLHRGSSRFYEMYQHYNDIRNEARIARRRMADSKTRLRPLRMLMHRGPPGSRKSMFQSPLADDSDDDNSDLEEEDDLELLLRDGVFETRKRLAPRRKMTLMEEYGERYEDKPPPEASQPYTFDGHSECGPDCLRGLEAEAVEQAKLKSPFLLPLFAGWRREVSQYWNQHSHTRRKAKEYIHYTTPCGRRLRDLNEVEKFLRRTDSTFPVHNFTFDTNVDPTVAYRIPIGKLKWLKNDYSEGLEEKPLLAVNAISDEPPPPIDAYHIHRFSLNPINIGEQDKFYIPLICSGCSCEDDCSDPEKCECMQLTYDGIKRTPDRHRPVPEFNYGYSNRRLGDLIKSGIYECNSNCKCRKDRCPNRVVQNPIFFPMQLFKTASKGWGVRASCDIPEGGFVGVYSGAILADEVADSVGKDEGGDEYFADMDLIRINEDLKETEEDPNNDSGLEDDPDGLEASAAKKKAEIEGNTDTTVPPKTVGDTHAPAIAVAPGTVEESQLDAEGTRSKFKLTDYFEDERSGSKGSLFTIDAKRFGNVGRYFNHSCAPNIYAQNVLVDTHDLRFPWLAFFTVRRIRAGEEICWDYSYVIDSVPGKQIMCRCGAKTCRGRLL